MAIARDERDEGVLERRLGRFGGSGARLQLVGRAGGDDAAAKDESDAVAILRLVHEVRGHDDGHAAPDHGVDVLPEPPPGQRVDARGRLVEEQHGRVVHHGAGERQALLEAQRQVARSAVEMRRELEAGDGAGEHPLPLRAREAIDAAEEVEVLADAQIAIEREFLRHVADPAPRRRSGAVEVEAFDEGGAGRRPHQAAHHLEGGGLAGAVGTEQAEHLAAPHGKRNVGDGGEAAEALGQAARLDRDAIPRTLHGAGCGGARRLVLGREHGEVGVLEARRHGADLGARCEVQQRCLRRARAVAHDEPEGAALHDRIGDLGPRADAGERGASAFAPGVGEKDAARHPLRQFCRRTGMKEPPVVQQQHVGAALGLVEIRCAPDDGDAVRDKLLHHAPQLAPRNRIDADARFVEQQDARRPHQRAGEPELLLHAARKPSGEPALEPLEVGEGEQTREALLALRPGDAAEIGVEVEILAHRQVLVEAEALRHVGGERVNRRRFSDRAEAAHGDRALVRQQQPADKAKERRFPGAVGPDEPGDAAGLDRGGEAVDRRHGAEPLANLAHRDERRHGRVPAGAANLTVTGMPWRRPSSGSATMTRRR
jgi:hypothetical protein